MTSAHRSYPTRLRDPRGARTPVTAPRSRAVTALRPRAVTAPRTPAVTALRPRAVTALRPRAVTAPRTRASRQHMLSEAVVAGYIRDLSTRGRRVHGELTAEAGPLTQSMAA